MATGTLRPGAALLAGLLLILGLGSLASGGYIRAKAALAQWLLEAAWARTLAGEHQVRPWRWADSWPVARLDLGAAGGDLIVLADASGRTLAFGPGHIRSTPLPGDGGNSAIAGHRDTHFAALAAIRVGAPLQVELPGRRLGYRVTRTLVVDERQVDILRDQGGGDTLTLITCYPFDALVPGGPLRYVVLAHRTTDA